MFNDVLIQFLFPLLAGVTPYLAPLNEKKTKIFALVSSLLYFGLTVRLVTIPEDLSQLTRLFSIQLDEVFGLGYLISIDGLSSVLILLNALLLIVCILTTWDFKSDKTRLYYFTLFSLTWAVNGSLVTENLYAFFIFWEVMLIPLFILVGVFGGADRKYASYKFFIYTATGSLLMLAGILYMGSLAYQTFGSYDLTPSIIRELSLPFDGFFSPQSLVFCGFCLALFIKIPVFPFHSWLPDAHVQAPTAGSIILAGILLKLGVYGLLRFVIPVYPEAVTAYKDIIIVMGLVGIVYGALTALVQDDIKKVVAFSSISHMGYIIAGVFAMNEQALSGSIFQMISHGLTTGGLFVAVHCLYTRMNTKKIAAFGGVAKVMPVFAIFFFIMLMGSMAVPLTNGFVGEFFIIWGLYKYMPAFGLIAALGVILGPLYLLNLYQNVMLGKASKPDVLNLKDIGLFEILAFLIFAAHIIIFGIYPECLTLIYEGTLNNILAYGNV